MVGGSAENEDTDVAVKPVRFSPVPTVITLTAPARLRMACLNADASTVSAACRTGA